MKSEFYSAFINRKKVIGNAGSIIGVLLLFFGAALVEAADIGTPWPMFRQNSSNNGLSPYTGISGYTHYWRVDFKGTCVNGSPIVNPDGSTFFATTEGKLYNLTHNAGYNWIFDAGSSIKVTPCFTPGGSVCFGTYDGIFYCLDAWSGRIEWVYYADWFPICTSSSMDKDGRIYFCTESGKLTCLSGDGRLEWIIELDADVDVSTPAVDSDRNVYIGTLRESRMLVKVDNEGLTEWMMSLPGGGGVAASPTIGPEGAVYIGTTEGMLCKVDPSGQLRWSIELEGEILGGVAVTPEDNLVVGTMGWMLYLVDPSSGDVLWSQQLDGAIQYGPIVDAAGIIYAGTITGAVSTYYPDGSYKEEIASGIFHGPICIDSDGTVYGSIDWSAFAAGLPYPEITLAANRRRFAAGERLVAEITGVNPRDTEFQADLKVWMEGPDRKTISMVRRYKLNIPGNYNDVLKIYKYTFLPSDIRGNYSLNGRLFNTVTGELLVSDQLGIFLRELDDDHVKRHRVPADGVNCR